MSADLVSAPPSPARRPAVRAAAPGHSAADLPRYIDPVGRRAALVTPDAVALDLPLADVGSRGLALAIDLIALTMMSWMAAGAIFAATAAFLPEWAGVAAILIVQFGISWGVPVLFEVFANGQTLGKMALGLRVVTVDGGPVRFRHAAIRSSFYILDAWASFGLIGLASMASTRKVQRLGDLAAGTVVIRSRVGVQGEDRAMRFPIPPHLVGYAQTLDVAGLDAEDYAILRGFLLRAGKMKPTPRQDAAEELATLHASRIRHTPPPGTHPELFLLCLAGVMQLQDDRRSARTSHVPPAAPSALVWDPFSPATPSPRLQLR